MGLFRSARTTGADTLPAERTVSVGDVSAWKPKSVNIAIPAQLYYEKTFNNRFWTREFRRVLEDLKGVRWEYLFDEQVLHVKGKTRDSVSVACGAIRERLAEMVPGAFTGAEAMDGRSRAASVPVVPVNADEDDDDNRPLGRAVKFQPLQSTATRKSASKRTSMLPSRLNTAAQPEARGRSSSAAVATTAPPGSPTGSQSSRGGAGLSLLKDRAMSMISSRRQSAALPPTPPRSETDEQQLRVPEPTSDPKSPTSDVSRTSLPSLSGLPLFLYADGLDWSQLGEEDKQPIKAAKEYKEEKIDTDSGRGRTRSMFTFGDSIFDLPDFIQPPPPPPKLPMVSTTSSRSSGSSRRPKLDNIVENIPTTTVPTTPSSTPTTAAAPPSASISSRRTSPSGESSSSPATPTVNKRQTLIDLVDVKALNESVSFANGQVLRAHPHIPNNKYTPPTLDDLSVRIESHQMRRKMLAKQTAAILNRTTPAVTATDGARNRTSSMPPPPTIATAPPPKTDKRRRAAHRQSSTAVDNAAAVQVALAQLRLTAADLGDLPPAFPTAPASSVGSQHDMLPGVPSKPRRTKRTVQPTATVEG